ncbi:winged helix-turn-helix domain-containing protein [Streptomyces sp. AC495_CC817]|uniref:helix-turn-helix domain-containing protein n=1 Tax=Streptomyces sp. AC495_CC817 TaxID=2823900 RepID=UPI0020B720CA|nr:winged helix-turn-helix domain-containing protein [Streptomyces sp. AC495_CC817]
MPGQQQSPAHDTNRCWSTRVPRHCRCSVTRCSLYWSRSWPGAGGARPDQTWPLSRIKTLIRQRFHKSYTVQGVAALLKRHGWNCQVPDLRAVERDEAAMEGWAKETWPSVEGPWRRSRPGPLRGRAGFQMRPVDHLPLVHRGRKSRRAGAGALPPPLIRRRPRLLTTRRTPAADLPALPGRPGPKTQKLVLPGLAQHDLDHPPTAGRPRSFSSGTTRTPT